MTADWTCKELDYLERNYKSQTAAEIAKHLKKTLRQVTNKANRLGLRKGQVGIVWTPQMLKLITTFFPIMFNKPLAKWLGVSLRTLLRKARELGLEKEEGFLQKRQKDINQLISESHKNNEKLKATQIKKGEHRGRQTEFKKGQKMSPEMIAKRTATLQENKRRKKLQEIKLY